MNSLFLQLYVGFQGLKKGEEGQDFVEYGLLISLIALAMIAGMHHIATAANNMFTNVSNSLA